MPVRSAVKNILPATSIVFNQFVYDLKRRGVDVTTLSLGEAFFDLPLYDFNELDISKSFHYSDTQGTPEIRRRIANYYNKAYGANVSADDNVLVSAGSKVMVYEAMLATLEPGDEVIVLEPYWVSYPEQAHLVGAIPHFVPHDVPLRHLHERFGDRTRMVIVNNPNNPAGKVYPADELRALYEHCRARGIYVLVDEAYSDFVLDDPFSSMAQVVMDLDGVIIVNSLSKNMGMSGWRIGYALTHKDLMAQMLKVNQHVITCAPTILVNYCARYFDEILETTLPQVRMVVEKRKRVADMLDNLGIQALSGSSTFYFLISIGNFPGSSMEFALELLFNRGVAVVPGSAYGASVERFVRVGIGTESEERIWEALIMLRDLSHANHFDREALRRRMRGYGLEAAFDALLK